MTETKFKIKYAGGVPWTSRAGIPDRGEGRLIFREDRLRIGVPSKGVRSMGPGAAWFEVPVEQLRYIAYEDAGTKSNIGALVLFGVFALGARREWTAVTVGFPEGDVLAACRMPVREFRLKLHRAIESCPSLEGRIVEGPPPTVNSAKITSQPETATPRRLDADAAVTEIERLAELFEKGLIDEAEFRTLKHSLFQGLEAQG